MTQSDLGHSQFNEKSIHAFKQTLKVLNRYVLFDPFPHISIYLCLVLKQSSCSCCISKQEVVYTLKCFPKGECVGRDSARVCTSCSGHGLKQLDGANRAMLILYQNTPQNTHTQLGFHDIWRHFIDLHSFYRPNLEPYSNPITNIYLIPNHRTELKHMGTSM